jgi:hypothetical protein
MVSWRPAWATQQDLSQKNKGRKENLVMLPLREALHVPGCGSLELHFPASLTVPLGLYQVRSDQIAERRRERRGNSITQKSVSRGAVMIEPMKA